MSFFLLSMCVEELMSPPKINTFWPNPLPGDEKLDRLSNPIPQSSAGSLLWELDATSS